MSLRGGCNLNRARVVPASKGCDGQIVFHVGIRANLLASALDYIPRRGRAGLAILPGNAHIGKQFAHADGGCGWQMVGRVKIGGSDRVDFGGGERTDETSCRYQ